MTCFPAFVPPPHGTAFPAANWVRLTPSSGAFRGATSSTTSPTIGRCSTRLACRCRRIWAKWSKSPPSSPDGPGRTLRHWRARLALLGLNPSGLPFGLCQLRREGLQRRRWQAEGRDEHGGVEGLPQGLGEDDPGLRRQGLVHLHLVSGRHRSWCWRFRHDFRRRYSRLLHERRRQQGEGQHRLCTVRRQSCRLGANAERLDLVAWHEQCRHPEGCGLVLHAVGILDRA